MTATTSFKPLLTLYTQSETSSRRHRVPSDQTFDGADTGRSSRRRTGTEILEPGVHQTGANRALVGGRRHDEGRRRQDLRRGEVDSRTESQGMGGAGAGRFDGGPRGARRAAAVGAGQRSRPWAEPRAGWADRTVDPPSGPGVELAPGLRVLAHRRRGEGPRRVRLLERVPLQPLLRQGAPPGPDDELPRPPPAGASGSCSTRP